MVSLNYHRRHGTNCEGKHAAQTYTSQPEERKKGWKLCKCPIYASGSLNRIANRVATKQSDWEAAAAMMAPYIAANSWNPPLGDPPPSGAPAPAAPVVVPAKGTTTQAAADAYVKAHEKALSSWNTIRQKRYLMEALKDYAAGQEHLALISSWSIQDVKAFAATWVVASITANRMLAGVKAFFEWCVSEQIVKTNPARYKSIHNRTTREEDDGKPRIPFTDDELERMYAGCRDYGRELVREWPKKKNGRQVETITDRREYNCKYTGEDLLDFVCTLVYTGLRISDVATFNIERLLPTGECRVRAIKNHAWVCTPLPDFLVARLRERARVHGPQIFGTHRTTNINTITNEWRKRLNRLWDMNGPWTEKPVAHRFRHTFVRVLLQNNTPVIKVAELIGDTEDTVIKHYKSWVPEHQASLTAAVRGAFTNLPNPYQPKRARVLQLKQEQSA